VFGLGGVFWNLVFGQGPPLARERTSALSASPVADLPFCWVVQRCTDDWVTSRLPRCGKRGRDASGGGGGDCRLGMPFPHSPLLSLAPFGWGNRTQRRRQDREKGEVCMIQLARPNQVGLRMVGERWKRGCRLLFCLPLYLVHSWSTYKILNLSTVCGAQVKAGKLVLSCNLLELDTF
jgi:hypothetical protein